MEFTRKTIVVTGPDVGDDPGYENERARILRPFIYFKKTDGIPVLVDPDTNVRYWVDQESAESFRDQLLAAAAKYDQEVSVTIEEL